MALLGAKERDAMPDGKTGNPEIGARIRERRLWKGLTQEKLAALMVPPVDQATISNWETGAVDVSTDDVTQIKALLETTASYLYGETTEPLNLAARLRRIGLDPGNSATITSERIQARIAELAELQQLYAFAPEPERPPGDAVQGEPNDRENPTAGAG